MTSNLLHSLPDSWSAGRLKAVCEYAVSNVDKHTHEGELPVRLCNYTDVYKNDFVSPDMPLMKATATEDEIDKFHLQTDDVVITKDSESWDDIAVPALITGTSEDFVCGYHLAFIRAKPNAFNGRFLFRCIQSRPVALQLELEATGVTRYGIPKAAIGNAILPCPPLSVQKTIANYLDREAARIDALVAEKERMLALLEEKRAALISRAVTRGLNPNAPLKPSGLDWLGDIPEHWETRRIKHVAHSIDQGASPVASNTPAESDELGILKLSAIKKGIFVPQENKALKGSTDEDQCYALKKGDVLITRGNTPQLVADVAYVPEDYPNLLIPDLVYRLRVDTDSIDPLYLASFLITENARVVIRRDARGSSGSMVKVSQGHVLDWRTPLPPREEQTEIVEKIVDQNAQHQRMHSELLHSINLLKERRSALITAAVTGQIPLEDMAA